MIAGGHALVIPGSPRPQVVRVTTSSTNQNEVLSHDDAVRVLGLSEGATGGVLRSSDVQIVVFSQPVGPD